VVCFTVAKNTETGLLERLRVVLVLCDLAGKNEKKWRNRDRSPNRWEDSSMTKCGLSGMIFGAAVIAMAWWFVAARAPDAPGRNAAPVTLPADWSMVKELPAELDLDGGPPVPPEQLTLRVESGWLVVRLAAGGELQWHVVLARATDATPPVVSVDDETRSVDVRYGPYFIREHFGRLRVNREMKTSVAPAWPVPDSDPAEKLLGAAGNLRMYQAGDWYWLTVGAVPDRPDVRVRFQHGALHGNGHGCGAFKGGLGYVFCGEEGTCFDEGDLLTARRLPPYEIDAYLRKRKLRAKLRAEFDKAAPTLDGSRWFNTPTPLTLERLKGKVVLLDFWGKWCGPCVAKLPATQELHERFKDRGLVVIGVHSVDQAEGLAEFLAAKKVSFPVVVDSGTTAARYLVGAWPTLPR